MSNTPSEGTSYSNNSINANNESKPWRLKRMIKMAIS